MGDKRECVKIAKEPLYVNTIKEKIFAKIVRGQVYVYIIDKKDNAEINLAEIAKLPTF